MIGRDNILEALRSGLTGNMSTKRLVVYRASMALIFVFILIGSACAYRIARFGDLGVAAMGALSLVGGILAGLAGTSYRKPDPGGQNVPAQPGS